MTDRWKLAIGAVLTLGLLSLSAAIALGHVEEKSSFGLTAIFALLGKVELDFSDWCFRGNREKGSEVEKESKVINGEGRQ